MPAYYERTPSAALRPWFLRAWGMRVGADGAFLAPPDGCTSLLVILHPELPPHLSTSGPWLRAPELAVRPEATIWGFRIQPHAAREVLGVDPDLLRDQRHPADRFLGAFAHRIARDLADARGIDDVATALEHHFGRVVPRLPAPDKVSAEAVARINVHRGNVELDALAAEMDRVGRTISTRFVRATGMHPRQFARLRRAYYAITGSFMGERTWLTDLAERGETDHLDLVQELLELTGRTPLEFLARAQGVEHDVVRVG